MKIRLCYNKPMHYLFTILLMILPLAGQELQREYFFGNPTILSTDVLSDSPSSFELLKIPEDKTLYRIDARIIAKSFELHGIDINITKTPYITFVKKSPIDLEPFKRQLVSTLQERYPSIQIDRVGITPRGYLDSLPANTPGIFDDRCFLKPEGTFYVVNSRGLRHYLDYTVEASLRVLYTTRDVTRKETLDSSNTEPKNVPFTVFKDLPLVHFPEENTRYRSSLKAGHPISERNVEKIPLVLQNDQIVISVHNGPVVVEYFGTAVQEGGLYDIITILKRDGKRAKAKVIGEKRVELE